MSTKPLKIEKQANLLVQPSSLQNLDYQAAEPVLNSGPCDDSAALRCLWLPAEHLATASVW